jgi:hypothetical protein
MKYNRLYPRAKARGLTLSWLNLELSRFTIQKIKRGVNFAGMRTWKNTRLIRKRSMYNFSKAVKKNKIESIISILSHAYHSSSYQVLCNRLQF